MGEYGVYVAASARGAGVGRALLAALCIEAESRGLHKLVGRMFAVNAASRALARTAGFREIGVERRHGRTRTASGATPCRSSACSAPPGSESGA